MCSTASIILEILSVVSNYIHNGLNSTNQIALTVY